MAPRRNNAPVIIEPLEPRTLLSVAAGPFAIRAIDFTAPVTYAADASTPAPACTPGFSGGSSGSNAAIPPTCPTLSSGGLTVSGGIFSMGNAGGSAAGTLTMTSSPGVTGGVLNLGGSQGGIQIQSGTNLINNGGITTNSGAGSITLTDTAPTGGSFQLGTITGAFDPSSFLDSVLISGQASVTSLDLSSLNAGGPINNVTLNNRSATLTAPQFILVVGTTNATTAVFQVNPNAPSNGFSLTLANVSPLLVSVQPGPGGGTANVNVLNPSP